MLSKIKGSRLYGADMRDAKGITQAMLDSTSGDLRTKIHKNLKRPKNLMIISFAIVTPLIKISAIIPEITQWQESHDDVFIAFSLIFIFVSFSV